LFSGGLGAPLATKKRGFSRLTPILGFAGSPVRARYRVLKNFFSAL